MVNSWVGSWGNSFLKWWEMGGRDIVRAHLGTDCLLLLKEDVTLQMLSVCV